MTTGRISAEVLLARIEAGTAPVILDVRSRGEFRRGHLPGARHVPFWLVSRWVNEARTAKDAELVVYCGHGPRAIVAGRTLRRKGYTHVLYLTGHYSHWRSAGFREEI